MKRGLGLRAHGSTAAQVAGLVLLLGGNASVVAAHLLGRHGREQAAGLVIALTGVVNSTVLLVVGLGVHDVAIMGPSPPRRA